jgi:hypothetical protein
MRRASDQRLGEPLEPGLDVLPDELPPEAPPVLGEDCGVFG